MYTQSGFSQKKQNLLAQWCEFEMRSKQTLMYPSCSSQKHMGLDARKHAFGVSDHVKFKPVCSATETSLIIEILHLANLFTFQSENNKGTDKTAAV